MHRLVVIVALGACGNSSPPAADRPPACARGELVLPDGACTPGITAAQIDAVARQAARFDDLAATLRGTDQIAPAIDLIDRLREQLHVGALDDKAAVLRGAVTRLRAFQTVATGAGTHLRELAAELQRLHDSTGLAADVARSRVSAATMEVVSNLELELIDVRDKAFAPLAQLADLRTKIAGGCAVARLSRGGAQVTELCGIVTAAFVKATDVTDQVQRASTEAIHQLEAVLLAQLGPYLAPGIRGLLEESQRQAR